MAWYRAGTVTVTNGSPVINGAGTDFVSNTQIGEAFLGPDGRVYEVAQVVSAAQLILSGNYLGGTAGAQGYALMPTSSFARDLALGAAQLLNTFAVVRDGVGAGLFPDGSAAAPGVRFTGDQDTGLRRFDVNALSLVTGGVDRFVVNASGSVFAGIGFFPAHAFCRGTGQNDLLGSFTGLNSGCVQFYSATGAGFNGAQAAMLVNSSTVTNRSINAAGTVNASGADYAEYMIKAAGCGTIAPGDVCGVDSDGRLTRTWADARSFVVKSTDPAYVGGDSWAADLPPRPLQEEGEGDVAFAARMGPWETELEVARERVDRIAFCGQAPVNVTGDFAVGDYLIAAANGGGIQAVAIAEPDINFDQYCRRLGKVWAIRDGRAWVDVQHG
jgi:hypothetical protein